ncbi:MAG TPA: EAL domain-containing protein, partial [Burkholderiales bacterium]|nr:EAL domain-containing protein [Burkholderiales bacterium]
DVASRVSSCLATEFPSEGIEFRCGAVHSDAGTPDLSALLAAADLALARAKGHESGAFALDFWNDAHAAALGSTAWRSLIEKALESDRYALYAQPVVELPGRTLLHTEVFARQMEDRGKALAAATFMPMVARHGLLPRFDVAIAEKLLATLDDSLSGKGRVAINVAAQTVADAHAVEHLENLLRAHPGVASRLVFEMTEFGAASSPQATLSFAARMRALGAACALDNFNMTRAGLALLPRLLPDYVKLAAEFTRGMRSSDETEFLVTSLSRIAAPLEIQLIAQAVEDEATLERLQALGVSGCQGHVSGVPAPLA